MRIENSFIFVDGVGERTERRLWEAGVTHWDAFADCDVLGPKTNASVDRALEAAREALAAENTRFFADRLPAKRRWRLFENARENACFFDIETTGLDRYSDEVTTVSFHRGGETRTLVAGRNLTPEALDRELDRASLLVSFNGARFDVPFLETAFDRSIDTPHLDLMYPCKRLGLEGGLKAIERELGIERADDDVDGREAVRLWHRYERGDEDALDRLVRYNRADARNLEAISGRVVDALDREVFEAYR
ncbi:ribonuclease H-like domain-containing protein [Halalkalicoccus ordinarius]|uniref:ribonuclease H-like domain-containing protein n=1 Tax=Halalkalicoccus ordinarius TaxID=3116651 RepID=UPI00300F56CF